MPNTNTLPVSRFLNVDVVLTPAGTPAPNLSTKLILGTSPVIDTVSRIRTYASLEEVGVDFGTTDEEYFDAEAWFAQSPQPNSITIGRWANAATPGELICAPLTAPNQLIAAWTAIANGGFTAAFDGAGAVHINGLNFAAVGNLNAVAAVINTGLAGHGTCVYDSVNERLVIASLTTGAASSVSFLTAASAGTDISVMMNGVAASAPAAYLVPGLAAQSALATVQLFDNQYGGQWYALEIPSATQADCLAVASYIEAASIQHFFWYNSEDPECLDAASTTDVMFEAKAAAYERTLIQYSSTSPYAVSSISARIATVDYDGSNTTITLMFKNEPTIAPENLSTTQANAIDAKNGNVYAAYNDGTSNFQTGITPSGQYADTVIGADWLSQQIRANCYSEFKSQNKIPQTDPGQHILNVSISDACQQGVNNGLVAPGVWNGPPFGQLKTGDFLPTGFYVFQPPISSQSASDRAARKSVPFQVAAKFAGATQDVDVLLNVNP